MEAWPLVFAATRMEWCSVLILWQWERCLRCVWVCGCVGVSMYMWIWCVQLQTYILSAEVVCIPPCYLQYHLHTHILHTHTTHIPHTYHTHTTHITYHTQIYTHIPHTHTIHTYHTHIPHTHTIHTHTTHTYHTHTDRDHQAC